MSDFNLDTAGDGGYVPVTVTLNGTEYQLGTSAFSLVALPAMLASIGADGDDEQKTLALLVENLPGAIRLLSPELADAMETQELSANAQFMLLRAVMEVLNRIGRFQVADKEAEG